MLQAGHAWLGLIDRALQEHRPFGPDFKDCTREETLETKFNGSLDGSEVVSKLALLLGKRFSRDELAVCHAKAAYFDADGQRFTLAFLR